MDIQSKCIMLLSPLTVTPCRAFLIPVYKTITACNEMHKCKAGESRALFFTLNKFMCGSFLLK